MPSTHQSGDRRDRLECPDLREQIGEDPARWLDWDLLRHADRRQIVYALIDGIDDMQRLRAWRAVERKLADRDDRDPRGQIIQRLDRREDWLELHGERSDRIPESIDKSCECCGDGTTAADLRERDHTEVSYTPESPVSRTESAATEGTTLGAFATDGGDPDA